MYKVALEILKIIEENGFKAYIVGGFVRDYYLKRNSYDIDICTNALPIDLVNMFDTKLPKEKYGSVIVLYKNIKFEITTFRKELKYEDRKPVEILYTNDLSEDLMRRDFTINALCMDKNGDIIDYYNGKQDIKNKKVRCIGNTDNKLIEDPLRILRAIRFCCILNFKLDKELETKIQKYGYLIKNISYDRKKNELDKIFSNCNCKYGIKLLVKLGLDKYLDINLKNIKITSDILGIWAQIDSDKYSFNKNERNIIDRINKIVSNKTISKLDIYKYGLYETMIASEILGINKRVIIKLDSSLKIKDRKDINISTDELIKIFGKEPGKWINNVYSDLEVKIINNKLKNDNSEIKNYIIKKYM